MSLETHHPEPDRIMDALRARIHRPLTESEEASALRWARGETANLFLPDYAFDRKARERMKG